MQKIAPLQMKKTSSKIVKCLAHVKKQIQKISALLRASTSSDKKSFSLLIENFGGNNIATSGKKAAGCLGWHDSTANLISISILISILFEVSKAPVS